MKTMLAIFSCLFVIADVNECLAAEPTSRPNILFILADDLGWANVGFHAGIMPTPNIDRLKTESVEMTRHYVYPVCSPTRAALLSGRYATRFGITGPDNNRAYPWDTVTLPRALKTQGYDTALMGKWHLGIKLEWGPQRFGFDHSYGSLSSGVGPWDHRYFTGPNMLTWHRNGKFVEEQGHVTDLITREAVQWMESRGNRPFFLYVPFTAVHLPIREPEEYLKLVPPEIDDPAQREYAADIAHLDASVGILLKALQKTGKAENTLVIFTSDNGGIKVKNNDPKYPADNYASGMTAGDNRPLRGMKKTVYEGGIRVPTLIRWPGHLKPGENSALMHVTDWMPTFCALAGYQPQKDLRWDGRDMWPVITGAAPEQPRLIYTAAPGYEARVLYDGRWKLSVYSPTSERARRTPGLPLIELFDLTNDPNETTDLAVKMPEKVAELQAKLNDEAKSDNDARARDRDPQSRRH